MKNYERIKENPEQFIEYNKESSNQDMMIKEINTEITSTTPVTKKDILKDCAIKSIEKTTETTLNSAEPKIVLAQKKTKSKVKRKNLCLTCNNYAQSCIPKCIWHQDKNYIYLKFSILEINNFIINCTAESITFEYEIILF